jgi:magnesium-transporting ATPase (P-type)
MSLARCAGRDSASVAFASHSLLIVSFPQSADIILLEDDFTSLVAGVRQGRLAFENLKKVLV